MKKFTNFSDVENLHDLVNIADSIKKNSDFSDIGKGKTMALLFYNPSLRTRLSTQKAAMNLGMNCIVMNLNQDGWTLELEDGTIMNGDSQEHIKEAAAMLSIYCDVIGIRTFASLKNKKTDYADEVLNKFVEFSSVPVISLESAIRHPLQSFADVLTIREEKKKRKPKVVLTWAPHPKALPQAVANSFLEWMRNEEIELSIANPEGFDLSPEFIKDIPVFHNQEQALKEADFVYIKNWSSFDDYGNIGTDFSEWMITKDKLKKTSQAKIMHCLPVRRNVVISDEVLDGDNSIVMAQAKNREIAAQAIIYKVLNYEN
jgi:N-succinyl-L-ornithine transcarbamylase